MLGDHLSANVCRVHVCGDLTDHSFLTFAIMAAFSSTTKSSSQDPPQPPEPPITHTSAPEGSGGDAQRGSRERERHVLQQSLWRPCAESSIFFCWICTSTALHVHAVMLFERFRIVCVDQVILRIVSELYRAEVDSSNETAHKTLGCLDY